jgi:subtilisin family serine protease
MPISFVAAGRTYNVTFSPLGGAARRGPGPRKAGAGPAPEVDAIAFAKRIRESKVLASRIQDPSAIVVVHARPAGPGARGAAPVTEDGVQTLATDTVILEGYAAADLKAARNAGAKVIDEGIEGKVLLRAEGVEQAFEIAALLRERGVGAASPNFLRRVVRPRRSAAPEMWAHALIGVPEAWEITKGYPGIRVAVLDEGVDGTHPALRPALVAERDFIGNNGSSAMPDGDDAHGTACAGIIVSRSKTVPGIAPKCSLVAARIGMGDGAGGWVFDDFRTVDAIDWCWRDQRADVLSNSWGGGAPSDAITRAIRRAQGNGRNGNGAVVVFAAGNDQSPIDYPGSLRSVITVGASNWLDERKTRSSGDGESWWGSNYGPTMDLLAPGVGIATTDIVGQAGYDPGDYTKSFNGTSSAAPHVAGAAALMLSVAPGMTAARVRDVLVQTAKKIGGQQGWSPDYGWGRLDLAAAVRSVP